MTLNLKILAEMWETIQYVTTPLTLIAFIAALATIIYRRRLEYKKELISSADASDRVQLIEASLETYHLKDDNLTKEQKFELVRKVLEQKIQRQKISAITLVVMTIILAVTALVGYYMMNKSSNSSSNKGNEITDDSKTSLNALDQFITISNQVIKQKTVVPNQPLPILFSESRNKFESYWTNTNLSEKKTIPDSISYTAVYNNIKIYRTQETYDPTKRKTNEWVDLGIEYFKNSTNNKYFSDLLIEKAAIILEMSELNRSDRNLFRSLVSDGDKLMNKAYSIQDQSSKGKILRIWSRFYYDLSKPQTNIYSNTWDNTYLRQAYQKALLAFDTDTSSLKSSTQLCRCLQKLTSNPPQDNEAKWTSTMRKAFNKHVSLWNNANTKLTTYADRIPPLNILAVLGSETIFREWDESLKNSKSRENWLKELDSIILPSQEEVVVLVESSEYKKEYSADVYIDLSKIHIIRFLILSQTDRIAADNEFALVINNFRKARESISNMDQLDALKKAIDTEKVYLKLNSIKKSILRKLL